MKVKDSKKANPMTRILEELVKIGFHGGEVNSPRGKRVYDLVLKGRHIFQKVNSTAMRTGSFNQCVITVVHSIKDDKITWEYDDHESDKYAKGSSGLHSRLVHALGRHPGE